MDDRFYNWKKIIEERKRKIEENIEWERNEKSTRSISMVSKPFVFEVFVVKSA